MSLYLGLDLGGTNIKGVLVESDDGAAAVLRHDTTATHGTEGPDGVIGRLITIGNRLIGHDASVARVGVAIPGVFDHATGTIVFLTNLAGDWEGVALGERLAAEFGVPATLINDSQAFALAEARLGAGRGASTVVAMTLGTGIGGGLVIDGKLHLGAFGSAGEFGHQTIVADGPVCGCGNRGCLEALARPPVVAAAAGADDFEETMTRYEAGDPRAVTAVEAMIEYVGTGIGNLVTMLGPDRVVLGGGVARAGESFFSLVRGAVSERSRLVPRDGVAIVPAELGTIAGAIGAALAAADPRHWRRSLITGEIPAVTSRRPAKG